MSAFISNEMQASMATPLLPQGLCIVAQCWVNLYVVCIAAQDVLQQQKLPAQGL
jgi:hypothetical protein